MVYSVNSEEFIYYSFRKKKFVYGLFCWREKMIIMVKFDYYKIFDYSAEDTLKSRQVIST